MSEPTSSPSHASAHCAETVRRGSTTNSRAPLRTPLQDVVEVDRVRLAGVRSPQEDEVRLLDLAVRARPAPRSEHRRQTDDAGGVSGAVAAVDVVRAEDRPGRTSGRGSSPRSSPSSRRRGRTPPPRARRGRGGIPPRRGRAPRPRCAARSLPPSRTIGSVNLTYGFMGTPGGGAAPLPGPD